MLHRILPALIGAALAVNWAPASAAAPSLIGTLKCTAEVAKAGPTGGETALRDWKVDCAFEPVKGQVQHYAGAINDPGTAPRESGKAFLVWNVLAMAPEVRSGMLVGTYKEGKKAAAEGLVGGRDEAILLQPLAGPNPKADINVAPHVSVIELQLPKA